MVKQSEFEDQLVCCECGIEDVECAYMYLGGRRYWMEHYPAHFTQNTKLSDAIYKFQNSVVQDNMTLELVRRLDVSKV